MSTFRRRLMMVEKKPASPLPPEYQQVEYVGFSGTQYVETAIKPNAYNGNCKLEIVEKHNNPTSNGYVIGAGPGSSEAAARFSIRIDSGGTSCNAYVNSTTNTAIALNSTSLLNNTYNTLIFDVNMTNHTRYFTVNDETKSNLTVEFYSAANYYFRLGSYTGINSAQLFKGDLASAKIYGNGVLVGHYYPCYRKADGVIGFYDVVRNEFLTNEGSGTFTKGADV